MRAANSEDSSPGPSWARIRPLMNAIVVCCSAADTSGGFPRCKIAVINDLNRAQLRPGDQSSELAARIDAYELAFRMQSHAPAVVDISGESEVTRKLYGLDRSVTAEFGTRCLLARRLVEAGVRFVQLTAATPTVGTAIPIW